MRINEYKSLNEFIDEYSTGKSFSWENEDRKERFMGIDFFYNGTCYRMCREPGLDENMPKLKDGRVARYCTYIMHNLMDTCDDDEIIDLDWYADLNDTLDNWIIEGRKFRDVIMDDNTLIYGKD